MFHIRLADDRQRRLSFYLAMEEYVSTHIGDLPDTGGEKEAFFVWQVEPTVIFGRNQVIEAEVNVPYCNDHNINLVRRKSGGGCVYADKGNIMLSYISTRTDVESTFRHYLCLLVQYLRRLGLNAEASGRNDVLINGRKVSGNSFMHLSCGSIVHGTMLYNSDFSVLDKAITPSKDKLQSKGVASARQHVTNLLGELKKVRDASQNDSPAARNLAAKCCDIENYKQYLIDSFCLDPMTGRLYEVLLSEKEIAEIEKIEQTYLDPDFISGHNHRYSIEKRAKIDGVGVFDIRISLDHNLVTDIHIGGDFFVKNGDPDVLLTERLQGKEFSPDALKEALEGLDMKETIMNLDTSQLIGMLI